MTHAIQCQGFQAAGLAAGIKKKAGLLDLGLIYSQVPANVAGMFTRNRVMAAPVVLTKERVAGGTARLIVANAGCANCCTGAQGMAHALQTTRLAAEGLKLEESQVLTASTGVIGAPLPLDKIQTAMPKLISQLRPDGFEDFSQAIMTTDTVPKLIQRQGALDGRPFTMLAVAKGAGMIRPDLATMFCFVCTDAAIPTPVLQTMLRQSVDRTLNCITIDGDTSTNDTVLLLANGMSGAEVRTQAHQSIFQTILDDLLMEISRRLVKDGEGVTKLVEIKVQGAPSDAEAYRIADTVAHSPLVKTAFFGEDANWGRIMGAVGRAGVAIDPERIDIFFEGVQMVRNGVGCGLDQEKQVTAVMKRAEFSVTIDLHLGAGRASMLTCDYSIDYIKINADYRS
ncbi:MAG: bifunctional glutamate N-acetyltransferase/amino-acid acetyltransferase ArgJ [Desulfobacteraceae bacterium]|nr:bifunctional glutamate N-acetyltransferase/amino-acid acetyltransferase ArgJ [Desulfobacteraceae bacterium]